MKRSFRRLLGAGCCCGALVAVTLGGFSASSSAATACRPWSIGQQEPFSVFPYLVANAEGILAKNNLCDPNLVGFTSGGAMTAAVAKGDVTVGTQTPSILAAYNHLTSGSPMQFVAPTSIFNLVWTAKSGTTHLPVATSKNWKTAVKAWKGQTIGVPALGGILDLVTRYMAKQVGLVPGVDFKIVAVGAGATEIAALQSGTVTMVSGDAFGATSLTVPGTGYNVLNMAIRQGPPVFNGTFLSGYFATQAQINANVSLYTAIAKSYNQALVYMQNPKNKSTLTALLATTTQSTNAVAKALYPQLGLFRGSLTPKAWSQMSLAFVRSGAITPPAPAYSSEVAASIVKAATLPVATKKKG